MAIVVKFIIYQSSKNIFSATVNDRVFDIPQTLGELSTQNEMYQVISN